MLTLISHLRNEALLLPHWIQHHMPMFDTATIIDYASTDDSLDIVRTLAPHWRIVRSQNVDFDANDCDFEVMQVEWYTPGWKVALNTTEYLVSPNLRALVRVAEAGGFNGITGESFVMVDKERVGFSGLVAGRPFTHHFRYGIHEDPTRKVVTRRRLLHRWRTGGYVVGRHSWSRGPTGQSVDLLFAHAQFAPWDNAMIHRKMSIGTQLSQHDVAKGLGRHHLRDAASLEHDFAAECLASTDLLEDELWCRLNGLLLQVPLKTAAGA